MEYLGIQENDSYDLIGQKHQAYERFLLDNKGRFPAEAFDYAIADWHYDPQDHRCPHDAWVESLCISETRQDGQSKSKLSARILLLGAYHDGQIEISYSDLTEYNFSLHQEASSKHGHGDWLIDEIRLSENGRLIHEIQFWPGSTWVVECVNLSYSWHPFKD